MADRVVLLTVGTQGDIRPIVALGQGLLRVGYEVRVATDPGFAEMVREAGLEFAPLRSDFRNLMATEPETMRRGLDPFAVARTARRRLRIMAEAWAGEGLAACHGARLIIGSGIATLLAYSIGELLDIPVVQAQLMPLTPSPDIPPVMLMPRRRPFPGWLNLAIYRLLRFGVWQVMRPAVNGMVRRTLGLRPYPWFVPSPWRNAEGSRILYGYSRHVLPPSKHWPETARVTGYWFFDQGRNWQPPESLTRFLSEGEPPVYVGFGSMVGDRAEALSSIVLQAVRMSGCRAILATGWGGLSIPASESGGRILVIDQAPHDWLFPRVAVAVHHGGAGTTSAAVRAGIPSVVVPFFGDQPFWAWRLRCLGVAPPPLPRASLSAYELAEAMVAAGDDGMRLRAAALGERVRAEGGIDTAIEILAKWRLLDGSPANSPSARIVLEPVRNAVGGEC
ncbi:glycosyltransferase [Telmatospirillum siberiense]|uniref:Glycosyltransferase n=1 Tax=Telmatospirillum siberiense TaxID=382514 RepID=A0A2N3PUM2_9PROT|nr:glycosyltransferase [Telmatospirillum siberiense]PKU24102.1 glycosyltransferase [Telmatospirillum siberiense]